MRLWLHCGGMGVRNRAGPAPRATDDAVLALHDAGLSAPGIVALLERLVEALGLGSDASFMTTAMDAVEQEDALEQERPEVRSVEVARPDGTIEGVLRFRPASERALPRVAALAAHAGVALHAAHRIGEVERREATYRRVAEELQSMLLPVPPKLANTSIARRYRPAMRDTQVGGDFYDVFALPDGRVLVVVGDVMGKGIEAASRTSRITQTLRALALQNLGLEQLLRRCDEQVVFQDPELMATLWCGLYDDRSGELTFASLGHPPALLLHARTAAFAPTPTSGPIRLELQGLPLGMRDLGDGAPECRARRLGSGDLLVLYTDGVVEAAGDFVAGQQALLAAIERRRHEPLENLLDGALEDLLRDADHNDDALMLLLRRR